MKEQRYLATGVRDGIRKRGRTITSLAAEVGVPRRLMSDYLGLRVGASRDVADRIATVLALPFDYLWTAVKQPLPLRVLIEEDGRPILNRILDRYQSLNGVSPLTVHQAISEVVEEEVLNEMARARLDQQALDARRRRNRARAEVLDLAPAHGRAEMESGVSRRTEALVGSH